MAGSGCQAKGNKKQEYLMAYMFNDYHNYDMQLLAVDRTIPSVSTTAT